MIETMANVFGAADCEALSGGWMAQPANAWSSFAYSVVGITIVATAWTSGRRERYFRLMFGAILIATGVGSFLYHGPQPSIAGFAHDITFLAALWFLIIMDAAPVLRLKAGVAWAAFVVAVSIMATMLVVAPTSTNVITSLTVLGLVGSDVTLHRIGRFDRRWYAMAITLFAGALILNLAGRTGFSTCDPGSVIQFHAGWHVLSAAALGAYVLATTNPRNEESTS